MYSSIIPVQLDEIFTKTIISCSSFFGFKRTGDKKPVGEIHSHWLVLTNLIFCYYLRGRLNLFPIILKVIRRRYRLSLTA